ncbi:outer membrane lipoprotein-sorting protein [Lujinxingia litoralis]|uniref:Outer membrane lipoprotein-sorting protein n=1 Tax=Lujinxingia litoralis TaxID=2211119 RepID=A0A328C5V5_9DELT|nr:outer membrane lipoprotein-sorting protein [Lujinxingia litoralis]RAL22879.1 outer membrane lipoprotein-sorting protein [Lujinxingia litoralis]
MRRVRALFAMLLMLLGTSMYASAQMPDTSAGAEAEPSGDHQPALPELSEVLRKLDRLYLAESSQGRLKMRVVNDRGTRELEVEQWSRGRDQALMVIRSPARESGTATLRSEQGLWNYAPRADRLIRVPSGMLSDAWMGSHFSNDDLMRETSLEEDYRADLRWGVYDGERVLEVELTPRPGAPVVWDKVVYELGAARWLPRRARFFSGDRVERTMEFSEVREMGGRYLPTVLTVRPRAAGEYTRMEYVEINFDVPIDATLFTRQGLRRLARSR